MGAEASLVSYAALVGVRARWVSRLGKDEAGDIIEAELMARGMDVVAERDASRQAALCIEDSRNGVVRMRYYRSDSAATVFDGVESLSLDNTMWLHLTGIDLALSEQTRAATIALARAAVQDGSRVSSDVNYRPALWTSPEECWNAFREIYPLAALTFVGDDEAEILLPDVPRAKARKSMLRGPGQILIHKPGSPGAEFLTDRQSGFVPALDVPSSRRREPGAPSQRASSWGFCGIRASSNRWPSASSSRRLPSRRTGMCRVRGSSGRTRMCTTCWGGSAAVRQNYQARLFPSGAGGSIEQRPGVGRQA